MTDISLAQAQQIVRAAEKQKRCYETLQSWKQPHVCANLNKVDFRIHVGNRFWPDVLESLDLKEEEFRQWIYKWIECLLTDKEIELSKNLEEAQRAAD